MPFSLLLVLNEENAKGENQESHEPHREKTGFLPRRKQRRRSASR